MAIVARETVITCDRLRSKKPCGKPANTYTVAGPKDSWTIDLCDEHAQAIYGVAVREGRLLKATAKGRRTAATLKRPYYPDRK